MSESTLSAVYINHMGDDLTVVNNARVSFDSQSEWESTSYPAEKGKSTTLKVLPDKDVRLINFLARGCSLGEWQEKLDAIRAATDMEDPYEMERLVLEVRQMPTHWVPFAGTCIQIRMRAPLPVRTQLFKHKVGLVESELSRRYVSSDPEFHEMDYRAKPTGDIKQGSAGIHPDSKVIQGVVGIQRDKARALYNHLIDIGVCAEQARMELQQCMVTEWVWTGSLYAFANVAKQRSYTHAQEESKDIAQQLSDIISPLFPESWSALMKY